MFLTGSCGRGVGREMKSSLKCLKFATGPRGRVETSTRSTPNSGSCLILTFVIVLSFACPHGVEPTFMYYVCYISFELCVSHSGCLSSWLSFHSFPPSQDIFPPKCPAYVGSMSVSSCPPPHHHHTLDAIWLPLQCSA